MKFDYALAPQQRMREMTIGTSLEELLAHLPPERRVEIDARARQLIADERLSREARKKRRSAQRYLRPKRRG